jgi:hypothetical protein
MQSDDTFASSVTLTHEFNHNDGPSEEGSSR